MENIPCKAGLADTLAPQLRPEYRVATEKRVYQTSGEDIFALM
ncbi:DUF4058 family protein [Anthocerotibacter panamensis]|nr:DUF4058 family protein [Anthocerotibacter panamensis]